MVQKVVVNVYPIRYNYSNIEFLMIKRATLSYNWQCVSGLVEKGESLLDCAKRELFEETGYIPARKLPLNIPHELYTENEEDEGEKIPPQLQEELEEITFYNFLARIDQPQDPMLNPAEHTDWKWCSFEMAHRIIKWAVKKKLLRFVYNHLIRNPIK
ncbi:MAG: NUDIX domain-containing protein [Candidatus Hodarchaeales archaeon]|jgi:dATP pyrophosphohydrolase